MSCWTDQSPLCVLPTEVLPMTLAGLSVGLSHTLPGQMSLCQRQGRHNIRCRQELCLWVFRTASHWFNTVLLGFWTRKSLTCSTLKVSFPPGGMICIVTVWFSVWLRNQPLHLCLPCHPTGSVASLLCGSSVDGLLASGSHSSFLLGLNSGSWNWLGLNLVSKLLPGFSPWTWILFLASFKKT